MQLKTNYYNLNHTRIGYFPYTTGIDRHGDEVMMVMSFDAYASGCNPYGWEPSYAGYPGHEFTSREEAEHQIKYARNASYMIKSIDLDNIKIGVIQFEDVKKSMFLGNAA